MVARQQKFFTTEQVTGLLGLGPEDKWRVTKFVKSREYGIKPSMGVGTGPGSRRLYDVENVCEIGLALRLLETGLRSKVIGQVLKVLRREGKLSAKLGIEKERAATLYLGILVSPEVGEPLDASRIQYVGFFDSFTEVEAIIDMIAEGLAEEMPGLSNPATLPPGFPSIEKLVNYDVLLVAVGLMFRGISERLEAMEKESLEVRR